MIDGEERLVGWVPATLGDLGRYLNGRAFSKAEWSANGQPIIRIQDLTGSSNSPNYYAGPTLEERYKVRPGDLLVSWAATLGAYIWRGSEGWLNQHIFKVESFIDTRFHYYLLRTVLSDLYQQSHGSGMVHITKGKFEGTPVELPPLQEQRRIVAAIEEQFSRLDAGMAALERVRANLKRYRVAVLKDAVEGRLTEAWREGNLNLEPASQLLERILKERRRGWEGDQLATFEKRGKKPPKNWRAKYKDPLAPKTDNLPELPGGWCWATVEQLAHVGTGATPFRGRPDYYENGTVPWITSGALNDLLVSKANQYITEKALSESNAKIFPAGSLLVAMYGEGKTRGKVAELGIDAATNQACAALVFNPTSEQCQPYVKQFMLSKYVDIRRLSAGGVQPNLNLSIVRQTLVALPSLEEQLEIVTETDRRLSILREVEAEVEADLKRAARLRQSILKRAFEGKLVPQDPSDRPASELLERMRMDRERSAPKRQRGSKRSAVITEGAQDSLFSSLGGGR